MSKLGSLYIRMGEPEGEMPGCCETSDWAADEIQRLQAEIDEIKEVEFPRRVEKVAEGWRGKCERLQAETDAKSAALENVRLLLDEIRNEHLENCRIIGMSAEREAAHLTEIKRLQAELDRARADERQAMAYLNTVKGVVGGDDCPDMIERVRELRNELDAARVGAAITRCRLKESHAVKRQAMAYLSQVREIVGVDDFPDIISRVEKLQAELDALREALRRLYQWAYTMAGYGLEHAGDHPLAVAKTMLAAAPKPGEVK